jgi:hypothetical protein
MRATGFGSTSAWAFMSKLGAVRSVEVSGVCACIERAPAFRTHAIQIEERIGDFIAFSAGIETLVIARG